MFAAERAGQKIAIEVKGFIQPSAISDFHTALGQFFNYRLALEMTDPDRVLYLAVPEDIANNFFQERFVQAAIQSYALKLLVYNPTKEEIILWQH